MTTIPFIRPQNLTGKTITTADIITTRHCPKGNMPATFTVPENVRDILARCTITETSVTLPDEKLERDVYEAVNKTLVAAGGKWNRKAKAHLFDRDPRGLLCAAIDKGITTNVKTAMQAFYTPPELARQLTEMVEPGWTVLEPSAGEGAIAEACRERGATVTCIEIDPVSAERCLDKGFATSTADFLKIERKNYISFDAVVMNPPFTGGQDIAHITHAWEFVKPGGRLVAVASPGFTFRQQKKFKAFLEFVLANGTWEQLPQGSFSKSGTQVNTVVVRLWKKHE